MLEEAENSEPRQNHIICLAQQHWSPTRNKANVSARSWYRRTSRQPRKRLPPLSVQPTGEVWGERACAAYVKRGTGASKMRYR